MLQEGTAGADHPVCLNTNFNYSTIEKETVALLLVLQHSIRSIPHLGSSPSPPIVYTDHKPLVFLSQMYNHYQRLMRWALTIQDYHLDIGHERVAANFFGDALPRLYVLQSSRILLYCT